MCDVMCAACHTDVLFVLQALRSLEGNEAQVCFFIIQLLLLKPSDFRNRVRDFVNDVSGP